MASSRRSTQTALTAEPQYSVRPALEGDRYLLCTAGLWRVVSGENIAQTAFKYVDPDQCAERLVMMAPRGGGPENITVVVADVVSETA